jgi:DNA mismatch repair ATPase MutS
VGNDVTVGPPGTFLLVTGSNMSGKTTLLRALGANAVLARAGAPVCARALRMPPVELATSVAVEDSLEEGVSFFLAELLRLKAVVQKAEEAAGRSSRRLLYLLDEVLRGTNSAERRVAVGRVIGRLLAVGAIGAVTTHDLEMLAEGDLEAAAVPIHFRETVAPRPGGGADMTFDYLARPGLATTTNALRLLEAVGLSTHEPPDEPLDEAPPEEAET